MCVCVYIYIAVRWDDLEGDRDGQKRVCPPDGYNAAAIIYNIMLLYYYIAARK